MYEDILEFPNLEAMCIDKAFMINKDKLKRYINILYKTNIGTYIAETKNKKYIEPYRGVHSLEDTGLDD